MYGNDSDTDGYGAVDTTPDAPGAVNCPLCGAPGSGLCGDCGGTVQGGVDPRPYQQ